MLTELRHYTRLAIGLQRAVRAPLPSDPAEFVRHRFRHRESNFLDLMRRVVFAQPNHPFHVMFRLAGCEHGDLVNQVRRDGLEPTLSRLRAAGVYLAHGEWKGSIPIVRQGREIPATPESFRNPLVTGWVQESTSGSTGRPVTSSRSTAAEIHKQVYHMLRVREMGLAGRAWIDVKDILPETLGLTSAVRGYRLGTPPDRWFSVGSLQRDGHYRAMTRLMVSFANLFGARAPYPTYLPPNDYTPVARHIARRRSEGRLAVVQGIASPLVRVAAAAIEKGYDISGTIFLCGGEALTPGKHKVFAAAGSRAFPGYGMSEVGQVGGACASMHGNCVHLFEDSVAAIAWRRPAPYAEEVEVNSLHFTLLLPYAPNVFVNIEMEDEGFIQPATCDCVYTRLGLSRCIDRISSFGKISPQGMTFAGSDLVQVLEEALPARAGGRPGDFQLVECEAANHQTQLRLHISPRLGIAHPDQVRDAFLELMRPRWGGALATRQWIHSGAVEAVIAEPYVTRTGKVHPLRLLGAPSPERAAEATHAP